MSIKYFLISRINGGWFMISEFLWLELIEKKNDSIHCSCNLPDPDPYGDERMVQCGDVLYVAPSASNNAVISIKLFSNFKDLCIGDSYQRKDFVQTLMLILCMNYGVICEKTYVELSDFWGTYSGDLDTIDDSIRSVE